jgi:glutaredoxin 3
MAHVTLYTKPFCPYCARALSLLKAKGADFTEVEAAFDPEKRKEMLARGGGSTYPQIFVGDRLIGGCDEMLGLDRAGELDAILAG